MPKLSQQRQNILEISLFTLMRLMEPDEAETLRSAGIKFRTKYIQPQFFDKDMDTIEDALFMLLCIVSSRYLSDRSHRITKPQENLLYFTLNIYKIHEPTLFREQLRISPAVFDSLVAILEKERVFKNNSMNEQVPVDEQVAIALYRLGHYGNAASMTKVGLWSGRGHGTVALITKRVLTAILAPRFRVPAMRMPSEEEKEASRQWSALKSCEQWRGGWCGVDGTCISLHERPALYGNAYFDRKSNYSTNVQIVSLLHSMRIFEAALGFPGSTHDATAWKETAFYQRHEDYLAPGEWIWADSAYPISEWVVAPFKAPEKNTLENTAFNERVSAIRVRSEHAIGYLKGRFQSLKRLRISIRKPGHVKFMVAWILAAICVHNFALDQETIGDNSNDDFFTDGCQYEGHLNQGMAMGGLEETTQARQASLARGKEKREELKRSLFEYI